MPTPSSIDERRLHFLDTLALLIARYHLAQAHADKPGSADTSLRPRKSLKVRAKPASQAGRKRSVTTTISPSNSQEIKLNG